MFYVGKSAESWTLLFYWQKKFGKLDFCHFYWWKKLGKLNLIIFNAGKRCGKLDFANKNNNVQFSALFPT
jgi:hypothetical protein